MKVYKITQDNSTPLIMDNLNLEDMFGGLEYEELGNKYLIEVIDMKKNEFDNLPEWGGF